MVSYRTFEEYERAMKGEPEPVEDLTLHVRRESLEQTAYRRHVAQQEFAADRREYALANREPGALLEWGTREVGKVILVLLPVLAVAFYVLWSLIS